MDLLEIGAVVRRAHMLEHADRDDAIVLPALVAIVAQRKLHTVPEPVLTRQSLRLPQLLTGERQPVNGDALQSCEVYGEVAPATADLEDLQVGLEQELGRDVQ